MIDWNTRPGARSKTMHAPKPPQTSEWRKLLELNKPYLVLSVEVAELEGKKYVMIFADGDDWKEFAIYTAVGEKIEEIVRKVQALVEKAENDESYDPVPEIASLVSEITDTFVIGEVPEEMGICSEDEYVAYPHEDERLNWPLCYGGPYAIPDLHLLLRYNLLPEEWIPHIEKLLPR